MNEEQKLRHLYQAIVDLDAVARERGDRFGVCDCVDNAGNPYPSQWLADLLKEAREFPGVSETLKKPINPKWSTASQWPRR